MTVLCHRILIMIDGIEGFIGGDTRNNCDNRCLQRDYNIGGFTHRRPSINPDSLVTSFTAVGATEADDRF